jgi:GNAT superfamily N-acetyltransferase
MREVTVTLTDAPAAADLDRIEEGLTRFNEERWAPVDWRPLAVLVRDAAGEVIGGLDGNTMWGWLFVKHLWLPDALRGQDLGTKLMQEAEAEALRRGCRHALLDTFGFQAQGFYEKLGYRPFARLDDYPGANTRTYLVKDLVA